MVQVPLIFILASAHDAGKARLAIARAVRRFIVHSIVLRLGESSALPQPIISVAIAL
jgi:hypothetical protein